MVVGCDPFPPLTKQITLIVDRVSGQVVSTIPFGGEDAVAYDPLSNRYFLPAFFHQKNNVPGDISTATPTLGVIDATTKELVAELPTGLFAHSISVDSFGQKVFVPHGAGPAAVGFPAAGVTVFSTH